MKSGLPKNHGLSEDSQQHLLFYDGGQPSLSDVQHQALEAGVARDASMLVVSPTSTGKTQLAVWAIAKGIESGCRTVYLVTHRALAKQKFEDFKSLFLSRFLSGAAASLVLATGDNVEDAEGEFPSDPLKASLLVATYEKYLAMLSASGVPRDMGNTVVVCDEIQLIGDKNRGQNVEILLTLLRNAGWRQFVGLSAVLVSRDAHDLANWLGVQLIMQETREKHLSYECWSDGKVAQVKTSSPDVTREVSLHMPSAGGGVVSALKLLLASKSPPVPIIVFCMKKQDTYDLASNFVKAVHGGINPQLSLAFDGLPETSANTFLAGILEHRVASHSSDLTDEERQVVERHLAEGKLDVIFATSTLAAGVNFPLGAAIFASWTRWDFDRGDHIPIPTSEFHNMAGRVGRMGFGHDEGRVIFFASSQQLRVAQTYLELGALPQIEPRIQPDRFNQLALQLVASGLCIDRDEVVRVICESFSALREQDRNNLAFQAWPTKVSEAVDRSVAAGLLLETRAGKLSSTPVGRAVGYSGLLPQTAEFLLEHLVPRATSLAGLLPTVRSSGDPFRFAFTIFSACFSSPEFRPSKRDQATRFFPYPLEKKSLFDASPYVQDLAEPVWHADFAPINAAWLSWQWVEGEKIGQLERRLPNLTAGMLRDTYRDLVWLLQGLAAILTAAADKRVPVSSRPLSLHVDDAALDALNRLPRAIRRLSFRVSEGLPDDILWVTGISSPGSQYKLTRDEIIALRASNLGTPQQLMLGSKEADAGRLSVFAKSKPSPQAKANWARDACRTWKASERQRVSGRQIKRAKRCANVALVERYYQAMGINFERAFEEILGHLKIPFTKLDDKEKTGAPDYLVELPGQPQLVVELKSREEGKLVDYNKAVEVLAASEVHGYRSTFSVTLCHPGVDPSVAPAVAACERLCVVESVDLGEALLRYCEGSLTDDQLYRWLATPGQALAVDLPFVEQNRAKN